MKVKVVSESGDYIGEVHHETEDVLKITNWIREGSEGTAHPSFLEFKKYNINYKEV